MKAHIVPWKTPVDEASLKQFVAGSGSFLKTEGKNTARFF